MVGLQITAQFRCLITFLSDLGPHFLPMFTLLLNLKIILLDREDLTKKRERRELRMLFSEVDISDF